VLIGESPPPRPVPVFYQRLVGRDEPEAARTAREYLDAHSREQLFDDVFGPALVWVKRDHEADVLTDEDKRFVLNAIYRIAAGVRPRSRIRRLGGRRRKAHGLSCRSKRAARGTAVSA
jgi:hypothetical protein